MLNSVLQTSQVFYPKQELYPTKRSGIANQDDQNGRQLKWKTTIMEDDQNGSRHNEFSSDPRMF